MIELLSKLGMRVELVLGGKSGASFVLKDDFPVLYGNLAKGKYLFSKLEGYKGMRLFGI